MSITRREFLGTAAAASAGLALGKRLLAEKESEMAVRVGCIGVGARGTFLMDTMLAFPDVEVLAVCDINAGNATQAQNIVEKKTGNRPEAYTKGGNDWKRLLERDDLDAVVIATPWELHAPMAIAAMRAGKYVGLEVPACQTVEDCWGLIKAHEETGVHCMFLENVNYFRNTLAVTRIIREGLFGDVMHCQAGYQHDIRFLAFKDDGTLTWRGENMARLNGNLYPTHPIGPVAWMMNINRGDRFTRISSMSTGPKCLKEFAIKKFGPDHPLAKRDYALGDTNTSIIETANGRTVTLYFDIVTPRPYDMIFRIQGTKGTYEGNHDAIYIDGVSPKEHQWEQFTPKYSEKYDHQIWRELGEEALKNGGHGGCDYIMIHQFLKAVRAKAAPPIDIVDGVTWSAIVGLSVESVAKHGQALEFPDFTRGQWKTSRPA
jgi:predicted dehydrogenase